MLEAFAVTAYAFLMSLIFGSLAAVGVWIERPKASAPLARIHRRDVAMSVSRGMRGKGKGQ